MLTKDLLKYSCRAGRFYPKWVQVDSNSLAVAQELLTSYRSHIGLEYRALESEVVDRLPGLPAFARGLKKLLDDRLVMSEVTGAAKDRLEILAVAKDIRKRSLALEEFHQSLEEALGRTTQDIQKNLYADLAENRVVEDLKVKDPEALLHRYNFALVQGLVLRCKNLRISCVAPSVNQKRFFFRMLKFHRLLAQITMEKDQLLLDLSGPLGLFDTAQAYGLRLANFLPYVVHLPKWSIEAEISISNKVGALRLDGKAPLVSHYQWRESYIPEEFQSLLGSFENESKISEARAGDQLILFEGGDFSFPDFEIKVQNRQYLIELFHRWHKGQFHRRLQALRTNKRQDYVIGACRSLKKDPEIGKEVEQFEQEGGRFFWFSNLPTKRAVLAQVV